MSHNEIIRAWKDEAYRNSLSEEQRSHLLNNPAGSIELSEEEMESVAGGDGGTRYLCPTRVRNCPIAV
jgi:mersacidin/lichenicidin family type 2 lantibiotic